MMHEKNDGTSMSNRKIKSENKIKWKRIIFYSFSAYSSESANNMIAVIMFIYEHKTRTRINESELLEMIFRFLLNEHSFV